MRQLIQELQRRKVLRVGALYVVGAWVVLQVADLAFPGLGIPDGAIRYVWIGVLAGFPLALLFAWRYEITAQGILRTPASAEADPDPAGRALRRSDYLVLASFLVVALFLVVRLAAEVRTLPPLVAFGFPQGEIPSNTVAVMPIQNVTGDPDQAYFAAGIHDELTTALSRIGGLTVKAASSTRVYRNVVQPALRTGLELRAAHLVEGSVMRSGNRLRVNVRLISAATEENLWSESYEREIEDVLTLQNEVARTIAEQVGVELTADEEVRLTGAPRVNPQVYETYLRGMYQLNQYTPTGIQKGLEYLHQAVALDPEDPLAYAGLAQGYTLIGHSANPPPGVFALARGAAEKALALDPLFPEAHAAMAEIQLYYDWDWDAAETSFRRALQLNPNLEFAHGHYAWLLQLLGRTDASIEHMTRAQQIAPVTPIFTAWLGWLHWGAGEPDRAIAEALQALEVNPDFPWGLYVLGGAYAAKGMFDEALATYERLAEVNPRLGNWGLGFTYAQMGRPEDAREAAARLAANPGQKDLLVLGLVHAILGERDEAIRWLDAAYQAHVDWFPFVATRAGYDHFVGMALDSLWTDPRYEELIAPLVGSEGVAGDRQGRPRRGPAGTGSSPVRAGSPAQGAGR